MYPILLIQNKIISPIKAYMHKRKTIQELHYEIEKIRAEKDLLKAELLAFKGTNTYHQNIKELLAFKTRYQPDAATIGQVIFKHFSLQSHFFLVNRGSNNGIQHDMVATYNNCLIGRVSKVYPWYCKVIAITDCSCKVACYCEKTKSCGIHVGINQFESTVLEHVSHLLPIEKGDILFSSGEGLLFPSGFGLGRIKECKKKGLWHDILVEPLVNIQEISYCALLHKGSMS